MQMHITLSRRLDIVRIFQSPAQNKVQSLTLVPGSGALETVRNALKICV
jgi:hypothetical protein